MLRAYGGAQGIWVDKKNTRHLSIDGQGVTVSILHTGRPSLRYTKGHTVTP